MVVTMAVAVNCWAAATKALCCIDELGLPVLQSGIVPHKSFFLIPLTGTKPVSCLPERDGMHGKAFFAGKKNPQYSSLKVQFASYLG